MDPSDFDAVVVEAVTEAVAVFAEAFRMATKDNPFADRRTKALADAVLGSLPEAYGKWMAKR